MPGEDDSRVFDGCSCSAYRSLGSENNDTRGRARALLGWHDARADWFSSSLGGAVLPSVGREGSARAPRRARGGAHGRGQLDRGLQRVPAEPIQPRRGLPHLQRDVRLGGTRAPPSPPLLSHRQQRGHGTAPRRHRRLLRQRCVRPPPPLETLARPRFDTSETNRRCVNDDSPDRTRAKLGLTRSNRKLQRRDFRASSANPPPLRLPDTSPVKHIRSPAFLSPSSRSQGGEEGCLSPDARMVQVPRGGPDGAHGAPQRPRPHRPGGRGYARRRRPSSSSSSCTAANTTHRVFPWIPARSTSGSCEDPQTLSSTNSTTSSRVTVSSPRVCRRPRDTPTLTRRRSRRGSRGFSQRERRSSHHGRDGVSSTRRRTRDARRPGRRRPFGRLGRAPKTRKTPKVLKVPKGLKVPIR